MAYAGFDGLDSAQRECLLLHLAGMYAQEVNATIERESGFVIRSPLERVALFIQEFIAACGEQLDNTHWFIQFPITQVELARYLRLSPEHANRLIHRLRDHNFITTDSRWPAVTINLTALPTLRPDLWEISIKGQL